MRLLGIAVTGLLLVPTAGIAQEDRREPSWENPRVQRLATPELQTFEDERDFRRWVRDVRNVQRYLRDDRRVEYGEDAIIVAAANIQQQECDPTIEECPEEMRIVVTGSRVAAPTFNSASPVTSITNNQVASVDEGDIVKRIGDYLLVLQDGRIFAANFRTMELTDRIDVYRTDEDGDPIGADWYDEMLVFGDQILITAYSYSEDASELSVFRLDEATGRLERRGVFLISSEDYYDVENYATRLVGDQLVIQTSYEPEDLVNTRNRPAVRRWVPDEDFDDRGDWGDSILDAEDIYRPVFGTSEPYVHTISVCDLGELDDDTLECRSTGFIGSYSSEMFVSPNNVYLWTYAISDDDWDYWWDCDAGLANDPAPGAVFRLPLRRGDPDLLPTRGYVPNQFAMQEVDNRFRAMLGWPAVDCVYGKGFDEIAVGFELADSSIGAFTEVWREPRDRDFATLPGRPEERQQIRFTRDWLVYGAMALGGRPPADEDDIVRWQEMVAVPLANPGNAEIVELGHGVTRIEVLGVDVIVTGYRDIAGLNISYVDLTDTASIRSTTLLEGRFESESRSHAFNAMPYPEGDGLMGLPTVRWSRDVARYPWWSQDSQLSFLRFTAAGDLSDLGAIDPAPIDRDAIVYGRGDRTEYPNGYVCEVSCVDWYGNSRPIFIERSVFALMGTELVEAYAGEDNVQVVRRLDLTGDLPE